MRGVRFFLGLVVVLIVAVAAGTTASARGRIVLGDHAFAPSGGGFGTAHPRSIFNGGDPSGLIERIHWHHWGNKTATGVGLTAIFKPRGGYYPKLVHARLRATRLGRCRAHGPRAYRRLWVREPRRPGGRYGRWFLWSGSKTICRD
jgi:hypothetical protein